MEVRLGDVKKQQVHTNSNAIFTKLFRLNNSPYQVIYCQTQSLKTPEGESWLSGRKIRTKRKENEGNLEIDRKKEKKE